MWDIVLVAPHAIGLVPELAAGAPHAIGLVPELAAGTTVSLVCFQAV